MKDDALHDIERMALRWIHHFDVCAVGRMPCALSLRPIGAAGLAVATATPSACALFGRSAEDLQALKHDCKRNGETQACLKQAAEPRQALHRAKAGRDTTVWR